jgi:thiamine pyrophosphokinase
MNACIFTNDEFDFHPSESTDSGDCISCDFVIAADGGAGRCLDLGIKPDLIVGNTDSVEAVAESEIAGIEKVLFPREKDRTNTEYAIDEAFDRHCSQITILGGTGGRIDHAMENMALLARYAGKVALVTRHGLLVGLGPLHECRLSGSTGALVSIVAWGENARVRSKGLKYPFDGERIEAGSRGISNEISEGASSIYVITGTILLFVEKMFRFHLTSPNEMVLQSSGKIN